VSGVITNEGMIGAEGAPSPFNAGSGGSIYLTAGALFGNGTISANGGAGGVPGGGGGGRIALIVTNAGADFSLFAGPIRAFGSGTSGGAGTIYLRLPGQGLYDGTLIVDNNSVNGGQTLISSNVTDAIVRDVIIRKSGNLAIATNRSLTVSGTWSNGASFAACFGGSVVFAGSGTSTSTVYGTNMFMDFVCTTAGKTLEFQAGASNGIQSQGQFMLTGSESTNIFLRSTVSNSSWRLNVSAAANQSISHVDVQDSDASYGASVRAVSSIDSGRNTNWVFISGVQTNVWTGNSNTVWGVSGNWSLGASPISSDVAVIPSGRPRYPVLDASRRVNGIEIQTNASLSLAGYDLTVATNATITGTLVASGSETITFRADMSFAGGGAFAAAASTVVIGGSGPQSFNPANQSFYHINVTNNSGMITFGAGFSATEFRCEAANGQPTLVFQQGSTNTIRDFVVLGSAIATNITLQSSSPGGEWKLNVAGYAHVRGVDARDSNAGGGKAIHPISSKDSTGNVNWFFTQKWGTWMGTNSTSFHTAANWSPAVVPDASSRVLIDSTNAMSITSGVTVLELRVGGSQASTLTIDTNLTVTEDVVVMNGGTLTHAVNSSTEANKLWLAVGKDLIIDIGGAIDVQGKGYANRAGAGAGTVNGQGGSYGGRGAGCTNPCYGSTMAPTNMGSGGNSTAGGGAIRVAVAGTVVVDGLIGAEGAAGPYNTGSGGSIYLTAGALTGIGTISANGGAGGNPGGGGGRIALILTTAGASFSQFAGTIRAYGITSAGAGTIYLKTAADRSGRGTVRVDNNAHAGYTDVPPSFYYTPGEADRAPFVVTNGATLRLTNNFTLGDIRLNSTNAVLNLNGLALTVRSREHLLTPGSVVSYGEIRWVPDTMGTLVAVR
jgi:hypothetical protein